MFIEIELKLALPVKYYDRLLLLPFFNSPSVTNSNSCCNLYSIYYDTPDFFLKNKGIALRLRRNHDQWMQTIKGQGKISAGLFQHREWEALVKNAVPDFSKITDPELKKFFNQPSLVQQIQPIFSTQFVRNTFLFNCADGSKIEICLDRGTISTNHTSRPFCEIELELKSGNIEQIFRFALTLQKIVPFSLRLENISKAERGYLLYSGTNKLPVTAAPITLNAHNSVSAAAKTICQNCLYHLSANEYGVLQGESIACLDQIYLATSRQQYALKIFSKLLPKKTGSALRHELTWFSEKLREAWDWQIFANTLLPAIVRVFSGHKGMSLLLQDCQQLYSKHSKILRRSIKSKRYLKIILRLGAWLHTEAFLGGRKANTDFANSAIKPFADALLNEQHQRIVKFHKIMGGLNAANLPDLWTALKEQCYAVEFFAALYPKNKNGMKRYFQMLNELQQIIGASHDNIIAKRLVRQVKITNKRRSINEARGIVLGWHEHNAYHKTAALKPVWLVFCAMKPFWRY